mgnify:FL=1
MGSALISVRTYCEEAKDYKVKTAFWSRSAGIKLLQHYNTLPLALELVSLGGIGTIGETIDKCEIIENEPPVENLGKYAEHDCMDFVECKYLFVADVSAWFMEYQFPEHKKEFVRLDYVIEHIKKILS